MKLILIQLFILNRMVVSKFWSNVWAIIYRSHSLMTYFSWPLYHCMQRTWRYHQSFEITIRFKVTTESFERLVPKLEPKQWFYGNVKNLSALGISTRFAHPSQKAVSTHLFPPLLQAAIVEVVELRLPCRGPAFNPLLGHIFQDVQKFWNNTTWTLPWLVLLVILFSLCLMESTDPGYYALLP